MLIFIDNNGKLIQMKEGKNRNFQKINNKIIQAFCDLIKNHSENDISITELCKLAKINRTTFYMHYDGIWDVTDDVEDMMIDRIFKFVDEKIEEQDIVENPYFYFSKLNEFFNGDLPLAKKMLSSIHIAHFSDKLRDVVVQRYLVYPPFKEKLNTKDKVDYFTVYIAAYTGAIINLYVSYFRGAFKYDLDTVAHVAADITKKLHLE